MIETLIQLSEYRGCFDADGFLIMGTDDETGLTDRSSWLRELLVSRNELGNEGYGW